MPGAVLPVKRPETDSGLIPRKQRDLAALAYMRINAKSLPPDLKRQQKYRDSHAGRNFRGVQIQDLMVDVIIIDLQADTCPLVSHGRAVIHLMATGPS
jgi:hypothetical protein